MSSMRLANRLSADSRVSISVRDKGAVNPTPRKRGARRGKQNRWRHLEGCSERD